MVSHTFIKRRVIDRNASSVQLRMDFKFLELLAKPVLKWHG